MTYSEQIFDNYWIIRQPTQIHGWNIWLPRWDYEPTLMRPTCPKPRMISNRWVFLPQWCSKTTNHSKLETTNSKCPDMHCIRGYRCSNVIGIGGQDGCWIHECEGTRTNNNYTHRNGAPIGPHANVVWQPIYQRHPKWGCKPEKIQSNGYGVLLVTGLYTTKLFLYILATWDWKFGWLHRQTLSHEVPRGNTS